ncbi:MAG: BTAD domain-containing putative transcriptional regulator [Chloroflexota bacterium]
MPSLDITLLGPFTIHRNQQNLDQFSTAKARALLAYLAVEGIHPLNRSHLAGLLWPDRLEASARGSLRHALSNLRKVIGDASTNSPTHRPYLHTTRHTVQINPDALGDGTITVDVTRFQRLYQRVRTDIQSHIEAAKEAVALYQGPFFDNEFVIDSPEFETWTQLQRDLLHRQMAELLDMVVQYMNDIGAYKDAVTYAQMRVDHEPWREEAHVQLMNTLWQHGEAGLAMRQYEVCRRLLGTELDTEPSPETMALYEAIRDNRRLPIPETATHSAAPVTVALEPVALDPVALDPVTVDSIAARASKRESSIPHNIPAPLKPFFGRTRELSEMQARFARPYGRQLTLTGPGGIGKTQLALAYARRTLNHFADGIWLVSLAGVADSAQVPATIVNGLGIPMTPDQNPLTRLRQFLRDKSLLLILDNFEHVQDAALLIPDLLRHAAALHVLVTSRVRLNLQMETVLGLHGLDLPVLDLPVLDLPVLDLPVLDLPVLDLPVSPNPEEGATISSAVALFVDCAQRADASFTLTETLKPVVEDICRLTDGIPLAIELAAVWTRVLSCRDILANLHRSIDLLTVSMPDIPVRHRCMRALFEESWQNLSIAAQQVFAQATIFRGGCDWPALQAVTQATMPAVVELVDCGFLRRSSDNGYQIHELMRQFGQEKLPHNTDVAERHARYYLHRLAQMTSDLIGRAQVTAIKHVSQMIENIHRAWQWALETRSNDLLSAAAEALFKYYEGRGLAHEAATMFGRVEKCLAANATPPIELLVRIRNYLGAVLEPLGRREECATLLTENLALARQYNLTNEAGWTLLRLAFVVGWDDLDRARTLSEESRLLFQQTEDTEGMIAVLGNLWYYFRGMNHEPALAYAEEALMWSRVLEAPLLIAMNLARVGVSHSKLGHYDQARTYTEEALSLVRQLENKLLEADLLNNLATFASHQRDYKRSLMLLEQSLQRHQCIGLESGGALTAQENIGRLALRMGDLDKARHHLQETAVKSRRAKNRFMLARCQEGLSIVWVALGDYPQARKELRAALQMKNLWAGKRMRSTILETVVQLLMADDAHETAATVLLHKTHHYPQHPHSTFEQGKVEATLQQVLGHKRYEQIAQDAPHQDIRSLIDSVLI